MAAQDARNAASKEGAAASVIRAVQLASNVFATDFMAHANLADVSHGLMPLRMSLFPPKELWMPVLARACSTLEAPARLVNTA